jgi:hypothetical protein
VQLDHVTDVTTQEDVAITSTSNLGMCLNISCAIECSEFLSVCQYLKLTVLTMNNETHDTFALGVLWISPDAKKQRVHYNVCDGEEARQASSSNSDDDCQASEGSEDDNILDSDMPTTAEEEDEQSMDLEYRTQYDKYAKIINIISKPKTQKETPSLIIKTTSCTPLLEMSRGGAYINKIRL